MPHDPTDFRIDTFDRLWFSALFVTAFAVIGGAAAMVGIAVLWNAVELYLHGERAEGTVLEIRETRRVEQEAVTRPDGSTMRRDVERVSGAPVVRFATASGRAIEFHGRGGSGWSFAAGDRVDVLYDPANPIRARIVSFIDLWLPSAAAFAVALLFGGAAWLSRRVRRRASSQSPTENYAG